MKPKSLQVQMRDDKADAYAYAYACVDLRLTLMLQCHRACAYAKRTSECVLLPLRVGGGLRLRARMCIATHSNALGRGRTFRRAIALRKYYRMH